PTHLVGAGVAWSMGVDACVALRPVHLRDPPTPLPHSYPYEYEDAPEAPLHAMHTVKEPGV
ncbi:MAG TPA: hypothetical protein DEV72_24125, partial [Ktedonobacter sp.]|nr:hypothetical protein [Ktedonobacter sp.]